MRLALFVAAAVAAISADVLADEALLARGRYLTQIMDCGGCHTEGGLIGQSDPKLELAGSSIGFEVPGLGYVYPPNLTSDPQTGLAGWSVEDTRAWARTRVEALNHALRGIPTERVRFHTCYSINMGPRVHDMELRDIIDLVLEVDAGAYSFEAANPRHEHEWSLWQDAGLPADKVIIPGVVTHSTVLVEHPDTVAERIVRFAEAVGRERVVAGADCGFASFAGSNEVHPSIVWAKFKSLVDGARIASKELWR